MEKKPELRIVDRERMSLLGLMIGGIIERGLMNPAKAALVPRLKGKLGVTAGRMSLTLEFDRRSVIVTRGLDASLKATISGSFSALLGVSLGKGIVGSFLSGDIGLSGNPLFALKTLPLFRVDRQEGEGS